MGGHGVGVGVPSDIPMPVLEQDNFALVLLAVPECLCHPMPSLNFKYIKGLQGEPARKGHFVRQLGTCVSLPSLLDTGLALALH
jgi:hypothetical protein